LPGGRIDGLCCQANADPGHEAFARDPRRVRYAEDARRFGHPDVWQLASSTIRRRAGDCEDCAILLADLLTAAGFAPRVVVGQVAAPGRRPSLHAWVELTVDGIDYLLDPTPGAPMPTRTPPRSRLGAGAYSANLEFDAHGLWLRLRDGVIPGALEPADSERIEQETE
jgi:transglutaminase-like putative cysteine protease